MAGLHFTDGYADRIKDLFGKIAFSSVPETFSGKAASYVLPIILVILAIVSIVVIVFLAVRANAGKPAKVLTGPLDLYNPTTVVVVDRPTVKTSMQGSYTLSFFLRLDAVPDMRATAVPLLTWAGIWDVGYNPAREELTWKFAQSPDSVILGSQKLIIIPSVPLQRWTQVTITFEGRSADFYVNGSLVQSTSLINLPPYVNSSVTIVPDEIIGQLAYIQVWSRRLTMTEIAANYRSTSDSQGRPYLSTGFFSAIKSISIPNIFCPSGNCTGSSPTAPASQTWEFPYA